MLPHASQALLLVHKTGHILIQKENQGKNGSIIFSHHNAVKVKITTQMQKIKNKKSWL